MGYKNIDCIFLQNTDSTDSTVNTMKRTVTELITLKHIGVSLRNSFSITVQNEVCIVMDDRQINFEKDVYRCYEQLQSNAALWTFPKLGIIMNRSIDPSIHPAHVHVHLPLHIGMSM